MSTPPGPTTVGLHLPAPPRQHPLFARKAQLEFPPSTHSADALGEVEADDTFRYHVKGDANGSPVRASEWISTHLAEEVGITAPAPMVIEMLDGSTTFGSRRIAGAADALHTRAYLLSPSNAGMPITGLTPLLSSIYAFDMFIFNDDRHFGNYLSIDDLGKRRLYTFDFSRAFFWQWPWSGFPPPFCNTRICGSLLRQTHGFDPAAAHATLDRLSAVSGDHLDGLFRRMPQDWTSAQLRDQTLAWWSSPAKLARLVALKKGLTDGTAL